MVLGELVAGGSEAAVVYKDCLFAEAGTGGAPPRAVRVVAELPRELHAPIYYQAAPLKSGPQAEGASEFVRFLVSPEGADALESAGLLRIAQRDQR
jgi:ABC-type molybdate transport system substrate-binding protein